MDKQGLLSLIVKISYPENSLSKEEQKSLHTFNTRYLYFYGTDDVTLHFDSYMAKAWRTGATALLYDVDTSPRSAMKTKKARGQWE